MSGAEAALVAVAVAATALLALAVGMLARRDGGSAARGAATDERLTALEQRLQASTEALQRQVAQLEGAVDRRLADGQTLLEQRLRSSEAAVVGVRESLARVDAANARLSEVGREIAGLHDLLRAPKARGGLGELLLEEILSEMLPRSAFALQHTFRSGRRVDAVIMLADRLIPVDAKFPLEGVRRLVGLEGDDERAVAQAAVARDVRRHVNDIAARYILPDEGTLDLALMYVPSERVYHEAILDQAAGGADLYGYCLQRRVVPVSPNTFYAYLAALLVALRGVRMEERGREIAAALGGLREDLQRFDEEFGRLGTHLTNAGGAYDRSRQRLSRWTLAVERLEALEDPEDDAEPPGPARSPDVWQSAGAARSPERGRPAEPDRSPAAEGSPDRLRSPQAHGSSPAKDR